MPEPDIGNRPFTGFPFGLSKTTYEQELRYLPTAELEDALEVKRWLAIEPECTEPQVQRYFAYQIEVILAELQRRRSLQHKQRDHPLVPVWNGGDLRNNRERIERVKARWPIELFLTQSLGCKLVPKRNGQFVTNCPLPYHDDSTPSFHVDTVKNVGYCFGCQRGGDVIELTRWLLNNGTFMDALIALEQEGQTYDRINTRSITR
ncbi:MAG: CHC2 zinc finger domain-containing protein [Thermomicrobiales bacterium]|nr:CHC2 zinc finger domain-containing protein [Thermomicrobiales bacterium]MCO5224551.1 CHC2 zinc finger domain-containing protein [Thermomicrobiales bacterium]MCO5227309.1 CHC2 zinc finger domain-containing protein [Thermomicrobiales bacterium]